MPEGVADNYTDDLFLKGLVHKNSFPKLHYLPMVRQTTEVINVLNTLSCLITAFVYLHGSKDVDIEVCLFTVGITLSCFGIFYSLNKHSLKIDDVMNNLGSFCFLSFILAFLTPVLQSLTVTYTSDTVTSLVVLFCVCHLWAYDFSTVQTLEL